MFRVSKVLFILLFGSSLFCEDITNKVDLDIFTGTVFNNPLKTQLNAKDYFKLYNYTPSFEEFADSAYAYKDSEDSAYLEYLAKYGYKGEFKAPRKITFYLDNPQETLTYTLQKEFDKVYFDYETLLYMKGFDDLDDFDEYGLDEYPADEGFQYNGNLVFASRPYYKYNEEGNAIKWCIPGITEGCATDGTSQTYSYDKNTYDNMILYVFNDYGLLYSQQKDHQESFISSYIILEGDLAIGSSVDYSTKFSQANSIDELVNNTIERVTTIDTNATPTLYSSKSIFLTNTNNTIFVNNININDSTYSNANFKIADAQYKKLTNATINSSFIEATIDGYENTTITNSYVKKLKDIPSLTISNSRVEELDNINNLNANNSMFQVDLSTSSVTPIKVNTNAKGKDNILYVKGVIDASKTIDYAKFIGGTVLADLARNDVNNDQRGFFTNFIAYKDDIVEVGIDKKYIAEFQNDNNMQYLVPTPPQTNVTNHSIPATLIDTNTVIKNPISATLINPNTVIKHPIPATLINPDTVIKHPIPATKINPDTVIKHPIPATKINPDTVIKHPIPATLINPDTVIKHPIPATLINPDTAIKNPIPTTPDVDVLPDDDDFDITDYLLNLKSLEDLTNEENNSKEKNAKIKNSKNNKSEESSEKIFVDIPTIVTLNNKVEENLSNLNAFINSNYVNLNNISKRTSEIRASKDFGVWNRAYTSRISYLNTASRQHEFFIGADKHNSFDSFDLNTGIYFNAGYRYHNNALKIKQNLYGFGVYTTFIKDSFFIDSIISYNYVKNNLESFLVEKDIKNNLIQASFESGYRFGDDFYIEPSLKINLAYGLAFDYSNDRFSIQKDKKLFASADAKLDFRAKLNDYISSKLALGYTYDLVKPSDMNFRYLGHEFIIRSKKDKRFFINFGSSFNITDRFSILLDLERSFNGFYDIEYQINSSFSYKF